MFHTRSVNPVHVAKSHVTYYTVKLTTDHSYTESIEFEESSIGLCCR